MKTCTKCKVDKGSLDFGRDIRRSDGLKSACKECEKIASREYGKSERGRKVKSDYHKANRDKEEYRKYNLEQCRKYNQSSKGQAVRRAYYKQYLKSNKAKLVAKNKAREATLIRALPTWANKGKIEAFYELARSLTESTGVPHQVDHIIPLRSSKVCGLHVESNLRVITRSENARKGNRLLDTI